MNPDHKLCGLMILCEKYKACIHGKILEEPKLQSPEFDRPSNVIVSWIQRLTGNKIKGCGHEKEANLSFLNNVSTYSVEWAEIARIFEGTVLAIGVLMMLHKECHSGHTGQD